MTRRHRNNSKKGHSVVEVALMAPWILLLFLAVFDFGYYMYAGISVANAARAAALECGRRVSQATDQTLACLIVKSELTYLPNASSFPTTCNATPLTVTATTTAAVDDNTKLATRVRVTYTTVQLFPLPYMTGRPTISRQAEMRVYE